MSAIRRIPQAPWFLLLISIILLSYSSAGQSIPVTIGLSKASPNYIRWLKSINPAVLTVDLYAYPVKEALMHMDSCTGLLLTGGEDVYPGRYGREADTAGCTEMNPRRDSLEFALISEAYSRQLPILGICRGSQILNVFFGGTLIVDIPQEVGSSVIHQCDDYLHCFHTVTVKKPSLLASICQCDSARVTTNHHQAAGTLAPRMKSAAFAADDVAESLEWSNTERTTFLLGVQWHPERMELSNPLSGRIGKEFLLQAEKKSKSKPQIRKQ